MVSDARIRPGDSAGWLLIIASITLVSYQFSAPFLANRNRAVEKGRSAYDDTRVGVIVWLFTAALLHTPLARTMEDNPTRVLISTFLFMLICTQLALLAFAIFHSFTIRAIQIFNPSLAALLLPQMKGRGTLQSLFLTGVILSAVASVTVVYCMFREEISFAVGSEVATWVENKVCVELLPQLAMLDRNSRLTEEVLGVRFSFLESPLGMLWLGGTALFGINWLGRRTARLNKAFVARLKKAAKRTDTELKRRMHGDRVEKLNKFAKKQKVKIGNWLEKFQLGHLANLRREKAEKIRPKDFQPMAEWYSLALADLAFQVIISANLFLERFDMRMLQATYNEADLMSSGQYPTDGYSPLSDEGRRGQSKHKMVGGVDVRYSEEEELWFDWIADTGDGANATYTVARSLAQPVLEVRADDYRQHKVFQKLDKPPATHKAKREGIENNKDEHFNINLPRGKFFVIGGDLAYPTANEDEYNKRLFRPFEYALESPSTSEGIDGMEKSNSPRTYSKLARYQSFQEDSVDSGILARDLIRSESKAEAKSEVKSDSSCSTETTKTPGMSRRSSSGSTRSCDFVEALEVPGIDPIAHVDDEEEEESQTADPPCCYAIPGNHDWYDGLHTFIHCICHRDWLGGWRMPQKKSYFAIRLPHDLWLFGLDYALNDDIDPLQYQYFLRIIENEMGERDRVILACHEPTWALEAYENYPNAHLPPKHTASKNLKQLMRRHLNGKVVMRIAGDVHNYIRYDLESRNASAKKHGASNLLVIAGGGGAFLHPTHVFPQRLYETGATYMRKCWYPNSKDSKGAAWKNIGFGFRSLNWKFDTVLSLLYFSLVVSFFPRCNLEHITQQDAFNDSVYEFGNELLKLIEELFARAVFSLITFTLMAISWFRFADLRHGRAVQLMIGLCHSFAHLLAALSIFLLLEIVVQMAIEDGLAGQGYDSFFESFQAFEESTFQTQLFSSGLFRGIIQAGFRLFDMVENVASTRIVLCAAQNSSSWQTPPVHELSRLDLFTYYLGSLLYMLILSADVGAFVFGLYLYVCSTADLHWNEAYSAIRDPNYKSFIRFKLDSKGDLHAFVIGIDKVAEKWKQDHRWESTKERQTRSRILTGKWPSRFDDTVASYTCKHPSRWIADTKSAKRRAQEQPRIVDYFCIKKEIPKTKTKRRNSFHTS